MIGSFGTCNRIFFFFQNGSCNMVDNYLNLKFSKDCAHCKSWGREGRGVGKGQYNRPGAKYMITECALNFSRLLCE